MFAGYWVSHVRYNTMFAGYWVLHAGSLLFQRRRWWTNIKPALVQGVVFAGEGLFSFSYSLVNKMPQIHVDNIFGNTAKRKCVHRKLGYSFTLTLSAVLREDRFLTSESDV